MEHNAGKDKQISERVEEQIKTRTLFFSYLAKSDEEKLPIEGILYVSWKN